MDTLKARPSHANGGDVLEHAKESIAKLADQAEAQGEALLRKAQTHGELILEETQKEGLETWKDLKALVRKHPGPALAGTIFAGLVFYALYRSSRD